MALSLTGEKDLFAVGGPAWALVLERMVGDFGECAASGGDDPDVGIAAVVKSFSGAVGDKGDARAIGRPLWVGIVPILTVGDSLSVAAGHVDDPEMASLVVEPAGVVELVIDMRVMADVALAVRWCDVVHRARGADENDARTLGRPLVGLNAVELLDGEPILEPSRHNALRRTLRAGQGPARKEHLFRQSLVRLRRRPTLRSLHQPRSRPTMTEPGSEELSLPLFCGTSQRAWPGLG